MVFLAQATAATPSLWPAVLCVSLAALLFLVVDAFIATKVIWGWFVTPAFWLLWIVQAILASLAFGAVRAGAGDSWDAALGHPKLAYGLQVLVAVVGSLTILQSLSFKVSGTDLAPLGKFVDELRSNSYAAIAVRVSEVKRASHQKLAAKIAQIFSGKINRLRDELNSMLQFNGVTNGEIKTILDEITAHAAAAGTSVERGLATKITLVDPDRAEALRKSKV